MVIYDKIVHIHADSPLVLQALGDCSRPIAFLKEPNGREFKGRVDLLAIDHYNNFVFRIKEIPDESSPTPEG